MFFLDFEHKGQKPFDRRGVDVVSIRALDQGLALDIQDCNDAGHGYATPDVALAHHDEWDPRDAHVGMSPHGAPPAFAWGQRGPVVWRLDGVRR